MVKTDSIYVSFWVWPKDGEIGVNIDNLQAGAQMWYETDSFYVRLKDGQIGVNVNNLQVVPKCGRNWLILCKI